MGESDDGSNKKDSKQTKIGAPYNVNLGDYKEKYEETTGKKLEKVKKPGIMSKAAKSLKSIISRKLKKQAQGIGAPYDVNLGDYKEKYEKGIREKGVKGELTKIPKPSLGDKGGVGR
jgi:predicted RNA-binding protein Jag